MEGKEYKLSESFNIKDYNKDKLTIILKGINNITDVSHMFCNCKSLSSLPDISKWNTSKVTDMSCMFYNCNTLSSLPDISKWDTSKFTNMRYMFSNCKKSLNIPSKFKN